ncbi:MAG: hypothetical protein QM736_23065 [Vicinamibacterales bacterium]
MPPAVISRGENGRMVVRATRLTQPLRVDGRLDEANAQRGAVDLGLHPDRAR